MPLGEGGVHGPESPERGWRIRAPWGMEQGLLGGEGRRNRDLLGSGRGGDEIGAGWRNRGP